MAENTYKDRRENAEFGMGKVQGGRGRRGDGERGRRGKGGKGERRTRDSACAVSSFPPFSAS